MHFTSPTVESYKTELNHMNEPAMNIEKNLHKVETSICYCVLLCNPHPPISYFILIGHLFNESCLVTTVLLRSLTKPADGHHVLLTEELEFLSMLYTDIHLLLLLWARLELLEALHYVGHMPIRPHILKHISNSAHRADAFTFFSFAGLIVQSDAGLAEDVVTIGTHRFFQKLQADRTGHLLLDHPQGWWGHYCCYAESVCTPDTSAQVPEWLGWWEGGKWIRETETDPQRDQWMPSMIREKNKGEKYRGNFRDMAMEPIVILSSSLLYFMEKWQISDTGLLFAFSKDQEERVFCFLFFFHPPRVTNLLSFPFFPRTKSRLQCNKNQTTHVSPTVLPPLSTPVSVTLWSST